MNWVRPPLMGKEMNMNSWNYRVIRDGDKWGIFEVYYNKDDEIVATTVDPAFGWFESRADLLSDLKMMLETAFFRPEVDAADLTFWE